MIFIFYWFILCPLQSQKNSDQNITLWSSDNSNKRDNSDKPVLTSIAPHFPGAVKFPWYITPNPFITPIEWDAEQVLFAISGYGILECWYRKTSHYSSRRHYDYNEIPEEEGP